MKTESPNEIGESLAAFGQEFGKVLDPVAFLQEQDPALCAAFLRLHELTLNDGAVSRKHKFLISSVSEVVMTQSWQRVRHGCTCYANHSPPGEGMNVSKVSPLSWLGGTMVDLLRKTVAIFEEV